MVEVVIIWQKQSRTIMKKQVSTGVHRRERQLSGRNDRARSEEERWEILIDTLCHQNSSSYCFFERERGRGESVFVE